jgi:peroxiredoxin (alkyl hydroperoxide reductase subunit C)
VESEIDAWLGTLPVPAEDGAAAHLVGRELPDLTLVDTAGLSRSLRALGKRLVLFVYPATGVPGRDPALDPAPGWDEIPGASGCTIHSLGYRERAERFAALGFRVAAVSAQSRQEQAEFVARHQIPFPVLNDSSFELANALRLPTFTVAGRTFRRRLSLVAVNQRLVHVTYPVFPPHRDAEQMLQWLERSPGTSLDVEASGAAAPLE